MCELSDTQNDDEMHRSGVQSASPSSSGDNGKRKHENAPLTTMSLSKGGTNASKKPRTSAAQGRNRTRLTVEEKMKVLDLLHKKVGQAEIARRFNCGERTVSRIRSDKDKIKEEATKSEQAAKVKSMRQGMFPELEKCVVVLMDEARQNGLPITQALVQSFGWKAKDTMRASSTTTEEVKKKLDFFSASYKWFRGFRRRHNIHSMLRHGPAGSVHDKPVAEQGIDDVRKACSGNDVGTQREEDEASAAPSLSYSELSEHLNALDTFAESSRNEVAREALRKARLAFLSACASQSAKQTDIGVP